MVSYVKGYKDDAGVDIVLGDVLVIDPGFQRIDLKAKYTPAEGEVAFLVSRGSTANLGIFPIMVAIDTGYTGTLTAWVVNASHTRHVFLPGERVFGVVNFKLGKTRVEHSVAKEGVRHDSKLGSSGGTNK